MTLSVQGNNRGCWSQSFRLIIFLYRRAAALKAALGRASGSSNSFWIIAASRGDRQVVDANPDTASAALIRAAKPV